MICPGYEGHPVEETRAVCIIWKVIKTKLPSCVSKGRRFASLAGLDRSQPPNGLRGSGQEFYRPRKKRCSWKPWTIRSCPGAGVFGAAEDQALGRAEGRERKDQSHPDECRNHQRRAQTISERLREGAIDGESPRLQRNSWCTRVSLAPASGSLEAVGRSRRGRLCCWATAKCGVSKV